MSNPWQQLAQLPPSQIGELVQIVQFERERRRLRKSYLEFGKEAFPLVHGSQYVHGRHFDVLVRHLEAVARKDDPVGHISRLLVNLPPGTGKSYWVSQIFVPWIWTWWPECRVMYFSYNTTRGTKDSVYARELIRSKWYQERFGKSFQISDSDDTKTYYKNTKGGWRLTSTPGALGTGEHMDILITDDLTSADQIESWVMREGRRRWYFETVSTRGIGRRVSHIINEQRLHVEDLSGHILNHMKRELAEYGAHDWHHICLPMWFEPDHPHRMMDRGYGGDWRTERNELVFPELLDEQACKTVARALGARGPWAVDAQLGQRPGRRDGQHFKCSKINVIDRSELPVSFDGLVRFWDMAGTEGAGCYTAGPLVAKKGSKFFCLDMRRDRLAGDDVETLMENTAKLDRTMYKDGMGIDVRTRFEREPGSSGKKVAEMLEKKWRSLQIISVSPDADKVTRSGPLASIIRDGDFYVVSDEWTSALLDEMETFPNGEFKDQVDGLSGAVMELLEPTESKSGGMAVAGQDADSPAAMKPWGPCRCECKRPAFGGDGYCCSECKRTTEAGEPVRHTPQCAHSFNEWWVKNH